MSGGGVGGRRLGPPPGLCLPRSQVAWLGALPQPPPFPPPTRTPCDPGALPPLCCSVQTILLAFVVGTLFLKEDKGLQTGPNGQPDVTASLASANNFLGVLFFTVINL